MAYTLEQIFEALGKADNGGAMVADLQSIISTARNEAAAYRVDRNKVLDALGIRESKDPEKSLLNMRTLIDRKSTRLNSSHNVISRMPSSA